MTTIISSSFQKKAEAERLFKKYSDMVYRVAALYMKNQHDAYDIVQDAFLSLLLHPKHFKDPEQEKAWILRIAINRCKDQLKSSWRRKRVAWDEYQETAGQGGKATNNMEEDFIRTQPVIAAIRALPDIYREVIFLFYYEGYKAEEIARIVHKNPSTIRTRLQKARELLKNMLEMEEVI